MAVSRGMFTSFLGKGWLEGVSDRVGKYEFCSIWAIWYAFVGSKEPDLEATLYILRAVDLGGFILAGVGRFRAGL